MIAGLLMIVVTSAQPPIGAEVTTTTCGQVDITVTAPAGTRMNGWHDLGNQPPMIAGTRPHKLTLHRAPGTEVVWGVGHDGAREPWVQGRLVVPPCISAPERPTVVTVVDPPPPDVEIGTPLTITRIRSVFWNWTLQRFGGVW
jgi:hypothetical protein